MRSEKDGIGLLAKLELMHISKYDSWNATEFPMSRFGEAPIEVPFK